MPRYCVHKYENGESCERYATYNYRGEPPKYCRDHRKTKDDGTPMVNVRKQRCMKKDDEGNYICDTIATFGYPHIRKRVSCGKHKEEGMVNLKKKLCCTKGCPRVATYFITGDPNKYCHDCAKLKTQPSNE